MACIQDFPKFAQKTLRVLINLLFVALGICAFVQFVWVHYINFEVFTITITIALGIISLIGLFFIVFDKVDTMMNYSGEEFSEKKPKFDYNKTFLVMVVAGCVFCIYSFFLYLNSGKTSEIIKTRPSEYILERIYLTSLILAGVYNLLSLVRFSSKWIKRYRKDHEKAKSV